MNKAPVYFKFLYLICLLLIVAACKKYEEGPGITFRTAKARLTGKWKLENYFENSADKTLNYVAYREEFTKDSCITIFQEVMSSADTARYEWTFEDNYDKIALNNKSATKDYFILRLDKKHLWYWYQENNTIKRFHLMPE